MREELREVARVYALAFVGTLVLGLVGTWIGPSIGGWLGAALADVSGALTALLFFGLAVREARRCGGLGRGGLERFGLAFEGLLEDDAPAPTAAPASEGATPGAPGIWRRAIASALREAGVALLVALVVFPPFVVGFWLFQRPTRAFHLALGEDFSSFVLSQFVVVGLPEEAFFRGYVQSRLEDLWPRSTKLLGVSVSPKALVLQALLFALVHLAVEPRLDKLATFFPGLLFGWLRARRGGVGAAVVFHALSNVLAHVLVTGWLGPIGAP